jgi:hypothetical protein
MRTIFLRALEANDKAEALRASIHDQAASNGKQRFEVDTASFAAVPRSPFAYWVSERIRGLFKAMPAFAADGRMAASGGKTLDDFRWIRGSWEVIPKVSSEWVGFAKGGAYSPFYADVHLLLNWRDDARSLKAYLVHYRSSRGWSPNWTAELHGSDHYLRAGLTWPRRTNGLSFRVMPAGCVFADKGPAVFVRNDAADELLALAAVANSKAFGLLVSLQLARTELAQSFEVGLIQRTPIPKLHPTEQSNLAALARRAWSAKRTIDARSETSHAFLLPALLQVSGETLTARAAAWAENIRVHDENLATIQAEIDDLCFGIYGIGESDRLGIIQGFTTEPDDLRGVDAKADTGADNDSDSEEDSEVDANADTATLTAELVSWAVGVSLGRFDVRLATGLRSLPDEPDPFDPLPACSPAMLTGDDGQPLPSAPAGFPITFPENGILVDDLGHANDLTTAVRVVFDEVFKTRVDGWWSEVGALLEPRGHDLRVWLASSFFEHHLKRYCKSRRKAPIIWQIAVPSGKYSVWLYSHRLTSDSLFQVQNDVVTTKLAHEDRQLSSLVHGAGSNPSAKERKEIAEQEVFVEELRSLLDEVKRVAPLWNPALDDGVALTMAPLWRLVPQHKPWQKELKSKWDELAAGKYDWSHAAMHLWPERVIPKCATDRSLAIAHGLEDIFWAEGDDGKWKPRQTPTRPVDELVGERTSVAVKAALKGLTEASTPNGPKARTRRSSS